MSEPPIISSSEETARLDPVQPRERIELLDILRGFALFGILMVNILFFAWPIYWVATDLIEWTHPADEWAHRFIAFFAERKFYPLFSFLFGLGMAMQMARAEERGRKFFGLYARRLLILLGIGLTHAFLIWEGDILVPYALAGFLLMLFARRKQATLIVWAVIGLALPVLFSAALSGLMWLAGLLPEAAEEIERAVTVQEEQYHRLAEQNLRVFAEGSWTEILAQRASNVGFLYLYSWFYIPSILGMFLLGLWAGRRRIFFNIEENLGFVRKVLVWGLVLGLLGNGIMIMAREAGDPMRLGPAGVAVEAGFGIGGPALCFFYIAGLVLLVQREKWRRRLAPLGFVGRMALSNYLFQSVVCTLIFNGYGLGLYGRVGPGLGILLVLLIFAAQIPLSRWWLGRFRFGPAEWLWRSLTYLKRQPMLASIER